MPRIVLNKREAEGIHNKVIEYRVDGLSIKEIARRLDLTEYFIRKYLWYTSPLELQRIVDAKNLRLIESAKKKRERNKKLNTEVLKLVREVEEEFGSITNAPRTHKNFVKIRNLVGVN